MGKTRDYLHSVILRQANDCGTIVWYDPEGVYIDIADQLDIPNTTIARYDGSFLSLRRNIDHLMDGLEPPRLVIYVPMDQADTQNALVELESVGVVMKPGQQPATRNTRLSVVARAAAKLTGQCTDECADQLVKDIEAGKYKSIEEIEQVIGRGRPSVLQIIFGTSNPEDIALRFLNDTRYDAPIEEKQVIAELEAVMNAAYEVELADEERAEDFRRRLARYILATDLIGRLCDDVPAQLNSVSIASSSDGQSSIALLAQKWRMRRDLREGYIAHANRVEAELGLASLEFFQKCISDVETFQVLETKLQKIIEERLLKETAAPVHEYALANGKQSSFWSESVPDVRARWELIFTSTQVLVEADHIGEQLKASKANVSGIFESYAVNVNPWCQLDTYYRYLERRYNDFDFSSGEDYNALQKVVAKARNAYSEIGSALAEKFVRAYAAAKFRVDDALRQWDVYRKMVRPELSEGKTAYILVDALRYEMAVDLFQSLADEFDASIEPAIAAVPTITEIGMAALLPGISESASIVPAGEGKLALKVDSVILKDRAGRVKYLTETAGVKIFDAKLDDLLPTPSKKVREGVQDADLVLVTSQEIDALAEGGQVTLARNAMDSVLQWLTRAFRVLEQLGVQTIVVSADHGYLFGGELGSEMKIDPPGGKTIDLHRRVWVGQGGAANPAYLRAKLSDFGLGSDLEIATPWNFAAFKVQGGANAYFHGGLSPQELVVPVLTLKTKGRAATTASTDVEWSLTAGSQKISTRFFSVQINGQTTGLFEIVPLKVRVEIRGAKGVAFSTTVSASYGFEDATRDIHLRRSPDDLKSVEPNTVTLMLTKEPDQKAVSVHLMDAVSVVELARLDKVEVALLGY